MWDNSLFDAEKIKINVIKLINSKIKTGEDFDFNSIEGFKTDYSMQLGFNPENKLARVEFTIEAETQSNNEIEAKGKFKFATIYSIENFEYLTEVNEKGQIKIHPLLINSITSITYSTVRGLLISKLQGTAFNDFMLPVINPNKLLAKDQE